MLAIDPNDKQALTSKGSALETLGKYSEFTPTQSLSQTTIPSMKHISHKGMGVLKEQVTDNYLIC
jgi:hypothetical protein